MVQFRNCNSTATMAVAAGAAVQSDGAVAECAVALIKLRLNMMVGGISMAIGADDVDRGGVGMTGAAQAGLSGW